MDNEFPPFVRSVAPDADRNGPRGSTDTEAITPPSSNDPEADEISKGKSNVWEDGCESTEAVVDVRDREIVFEPVGGIFSLAADETGAF